MSSWEKRRCPPLTHTTCSNSSRSLCLPKNRCLASLATDTRTEETKSTLEQLTDEQNHKDFHSRLVGSHIGSWANPKKQNIPDEENLYNKMWKNQAKAYSEDVQVWRPGWVATAFSNHCWILMRSESQIPRQMHVQDCWTRLMKNSNARSVNVAFPKKRSTESDQIPKQ